MKFKTLASLMKINIYLLPLGSGLAAEKLATLTTLIGLKLEYLQGAALVQ